MKVPVLPAVALLALLALHSTQGASLGSPEVSTEETTIGNYALGPEDISPQFLNIDKLRSAFKSDEFLNWHAIIEAFKRTFPFFNWDAFPKLKGLRNVIPDAQ
uniref:Keratinocyte differentiation associated protein n=1 Tax=Marmota marmota marmota TaxID=9994 RepID=A0A8C6EQ60_MARMA